MHCEFFFLLRDFSKYSFTIALKGTKQWIGKCLLSTYYAPGTKEMLSLPYWAWSSEGKTDRACKRFTRERWSLGKTEKTSLGKGDLCWALRGWGFVRQREGDWVCGLFQTEVTDCEVFMESKNVVDQSCPIQRNNAGNFPTRPFSRPSFHKASKIQCSWRSFYSAGMNLSHSPPLLPPLSQRSELRSSCRWLGQWNKIAF